MKKKMCAVDGGREVEKNLWWNKYCIVVEFFGVANGCQKKEKKEVFTSSSDKTTVA